jgi:serine/threonine protein kinase
MERIKHVHVTRLIEAFDTSKQVFIIMEYMTGGSLHAYLKTKPSKQMKEAEAAQYFH